MPRPPTEYTAEDREHWRAEIREAKRTMTRTEFADWLNRRINSAAAGVVGNQEEQG